MTTGNNLSYRLVPELNYTETEQVLIQNHMMDSLDKPIETGTIDMTSLNEEDYYEYDYDYDASINTLPVGELVVVALVYGTTLLLGVIGNSLVIFSILRYRRMQTVTNIFLTSLASADLMLVIICVPIKVCILILTY